MSFLSLLGNCISAEFCDCPSCVDHKCVRDFVTQSGERLTANTYSNDIFGHLLKINDEFVTWSFENIGGISKFQRIIEKARYIQQQLDDLINTSKCRKSRENLLVILNKIK